MQELSVRGWLITELLFDLVSGGSRLAAAKTIRKSSERLYMLDAQYQDAESAENDRNGGVISPGY